MFEEDWLFLAQQRMDGRSGSIAGLDSSLTAKEDKIFQPPSLLPT